MPLELSLVTTAGNQHGLEIMAATVAEKDHNPSVLVFKIEQWCVNRNEEIIAEEDTS